MTKQPQLSSWNFRQEISVDESATGESPRYVPQQTDRAVDEDRDMDGNSLPIVRLIDKSAEFQKLKSSFEKAFNMPLLVCGVKESSAVMRECSRENRFCGLVFRRSETCRSCLIHQNRIHAESLKSRHSCANTCPHGMMDAAVPIFKDQEIIGFLRTGQVFISYPGKSDFRGTMELLQEETDSLMPEEVYEAYFQTQVIGNEKFEGIIGLLELYALRLSQLAGELEIASDSLEPGIIKKTRAYIQAHLDQPLSLDSVSRAVHCNSFYLCKLFKKVTGVSFTEYINQVRLKKAKKLLVNQDLRISEVALDAGFQSITHFNRVFRKVVGCSPSDFRRNHAAVQLSHSH